MNDAAALASAAGTADDGVMAAIAAGSREGAKIDDSKSDGRNGEEKLGGVMNALRMGDELAGSGDGDSEPDYGDDGDVDDSPAKGKGKGTAKAKDDGNEPKDGPAKPDDKPITRADMQDAIAQAVADAMRQTQQTTKTSDRTGDERSGDKDDQDAGETSDLFDKAARDYANEWMGDGVAEKILDPIAKEMKSLRDQVAQVTGFIQQQQAAEIQGTLDKFYADHESYYGAEGSRTRAQEIMQAELLPLAAQMRQHDGRISVRTALERAHRALYGEQPKGDTQTTTKTDGRAAKAKAQQVTHDPAPQRGGKTDPRDSEDELTRMARNLLR